MGIKPLDRLVAVSGCFRMADQLIVAGVPLIAATVFGLEPGQIGAMVAAQGSAWLIVSLPAGLLIDRIAPLNGLRRAFAVGVVGLLVAILGFVMANPVVLAFGAFLTSSAVVLGFLSEGASLQQIVAGPELGSANARIQIVQSLAMLLSPALMGYLIAKGLTLAGLLLALMLCLFGLYLSRGFSIQQTAPPKTRDIRAELSEGFAFVYGQPLLRGIVACALFWNLAFMALAAVFVPYAMKHLAMTSDTIGLAQSAMGVGSLLAAFAAAPLLGRLPPRALLFFGPASSTMAAMLLLAPSGLGGAGTSFVVYLLLGFGPILWFVCQNTIRQLVTPKGMLGRVSAVIQVAIYGVRSIGALLGGWVATAYGMDTAIVMAVVLFGLSTATIPLSALGRLSAMPRSAGSPA
jgi:predicted MFS family arabinose efflux permease